MTLLDAFALVALTLDEPAAGEVEDVLRGPDTAITSVNLAEAADVLQRVHGVTSDDLHHVLDPLLLGPLDVVDVTEEHAWRAAEIRLRHYDRKSAALSLGDCVLLAAASPAAGVATADPVVANAARAEGLELVPLPDSRGQRP